jgi:hypothetical protein
MRFSFVGTSFGISHSYNTTKGKHDHEHLWLLDIVITQGKMTLLSASNSMSIFRGFLRAGLLRFSLLSYTGRFTSNDPTNAKVGLRR